VTVPAAGASTLRSWLARLPDRTRRLLRLPPRDIATILHATAVLLFVEALIRWVPLPRLSRMLGVRVNVGPAAPNSEQLPDDALTDRDRRQLRCTMRVTEAWPLSKGPCLRRSLLAGHLLRRHHPAVRLGMATAAAGLYAHAWLEIDDRPLESVAEMIVFQSTTAGTAV
jgi:hypothetical protein